MMPTTLLPMNKTTHPHCHNVMRERSSLRLFNAQNTMKHTALAALIAALVPWTVVTAQTQPSPAPQPREALSKQKLGFFVHYVDGLTPENPQGAKTTDLKAFARSLDVKALADTIQKSGAEYAIFTVYHAGMKMLYPSKVWGDIFPDKVADRDVIGELADELAKRNIRLVLYVHPNDRHDLSVADQQKLISLGWASTVLKKDPIWLEKKGDKKFTGLRGADEKWNKMYFRIIEELGQRYGKKISGYWQDGPGPDGAEVQRIMYRFTPGAAIWLNSAASRPDLLPANLLGGEYIVKPNTLPEPQKSKTTTMQNSITVNGSWWAANKPPLYTPENLYRMAVTMAATSGSGNGGFVLAAGPFADNTWGPGMSECLSSVGGLMKSRGPSIYGTVPGKAFPTTAKAQPDWGVSTESADGSTVFLHVLFPPQDPTLRIAKPADGRRLTGAALLDGTPVAIKPNEAGYELTLPPSAKWDPVDTVIRCTASKQ